MTDDTAIVLTDTQTMVVDSLKNAGGDFDTIGMLEKLKAAVKLEMKN